MLPERMIRYGFCQSFFAGFLYFSGAAAGMVRSRAAGSSGGAAVSPDRVHASKAPKIRNRAKRRKRVSVVLIYLRRACLRCKTVSSPTRVSFGKWYDSASFGNWCDTTSALKASTDCVIRAAASP
jgi:hypothetical protein